MPEIQYTCISCPMGCPLTLTVGDDGALTVSGNSCKRGENYAKEEYSAPKRVITATVACSAPEFPRIPVKTATPLPKPMVADLLKELKNVHLSLPVAVGDVVIKNFNGSGVNIVVTRSCQ